VKRESKTKLLKISQFRPCSINWSNDTIPPAVEFTPHKDGYYPDMPIIVGEEGLWDIGNTYLCFLFQKKIALTVSPDLASIYRRASDLVDYKRFLEREGISYLHFPVEEAERATYRYRQYLSLLIELGTKRGGIAPRTAAGRINSVLHFYDTIFSNWMIDIDDIPENPAYQPIKRMTSRQNREGFYKLVNVDSSDLAFKVAKREASYIQDGGDLRPLVEETDGEQEVTMILDALIDSGNTQALLMFLLALTTGMRLQPILTMRRKHIYQDADSKGIMRLPIGQGTEIDNKQDKPYVVQIPSSLVERLRVYDQSEYSIKRREKSKYGDTLDNYLFLSDQGNAYYTSESEKLENLNTDVSTNLSLNSRANKTFKKGESIINWINKRLVPRLRENNPDWDGDFRFHFLRATFCWNLLNTLIKNGDDPNVACRKVQQRMGHKSIVTTFGYLNYRNISKKDEEYQDAFDSRLNKYL